MRTSLAAVAARTLMSARRSTHSLRKPGAWSLVSIGMSGSALDPGTGTARRPRFPVKPASLIGTTLPQCTWPYKWLKSVNLLKRDWRKDRNVLI